MISYKVVVGYNSHPRTHVPTPRRCKIVHLVIRGTPSSVARQIFKHPNYAAKMVEEIGMIIRKELTTLCSDNANSILLRSTDKSDLIKFTWDQFLSEVGVHAPSLLKILSMAVHENQSSRNK